MFGPVFQLELVTSARRARYYAWRMLYASLLLVVLVLVYLISFGLEAADNIYEAAAFAQNYLHSFAVLQLAAVLLLGPALAAGAIARERERRTIEYLFTTHLTSAEIVLDKLAAAVTQLTAAVLAGVPVLAIAMLLGGITPEQLFLVTAVTLSTILAVTSIALAASSVLRRSREAVAATYAILFLLIVGPPLMSGLARGSPLAGATSELAQRVGTANPLRAIGRVLDGSQTEHERWSALWHMAAVHGTLSLALVISATYTLRRMTFGAGVVRPGRSGRRWLRPQLQDRPLLWREMFAGRSHSRFARAGRGLLLLLITLSLLGTIWQFVDCALSGRWDRYLVFAMWLGTILESLGLLLVASWASNTIGAERERETWVTLISTPLEAREIVLGKLAGSLYAARLVLPPLALVWGLAAVAQPRFIPAIVATLLGLIVAALAAGMLGIGLSFYCGNATRALGATLATLFAATTLGTCCMFPLGILNPLYLLVFPGLMTLFMLESPSEAMVPLTMAGVVYGGVWVLGIAVQLGGAWLLWALCISSFDRLSGRIDTRGPGPAALLGQVTK